MNPGQFIGAFELIEFDFYVSRIPEEHLIEVLSSHAPDLAFNKMMRPGSFRYRLYFIDSQDTQVCSLRVKGDVRVVIRIEILRESRACI